MSSVLVTGATGFVGRHLVQRLLAHGHGVIASCRSSTASQDLTHPRLKTVCIGDLANIDDWSGAELKGVDVVIHIAARVHVQDENFGTELERYREINTRATKILAEKAAKKGVKRFIFLSSIKVNGEETRGAPFKANDQVCPQCPYGVSKAEAEQLLRSVAETTGLEIVIIRPPLVYGPGVKANFQHLIRWVRKGYPLPFGAVNNRRSFVSVFNLVDLILTCMSHPSARNEVFLVSDGESISTGNLIRRMSESQARKIWLPRVSIWILKGAGLLTRKSAAIQRLCGDLEVDIEKTQKLLGWSPRFTMGETLRAIAVNSRESA